MTEVSDGLSAEQIETLLAARRAARASRDFKLADQIRDQLVEAGILIEDSAEGTRWRRSAG
jgi:cysteinyl-tRNA synthetase